MTTARPAPIHGPRLQPRWRARLHPRSRPPHKARPAGQRGIVLLVALVMLLLITVLGVTSVRMLIVEERMAGNAYDRNLQFQAAETALREGEALADAQAQANPANGAFPAVAMNCANLNNGACVNGFCAAPAAACNDARWTNDGFTGWRNATTQVSPLAGGAPQFFIEHLGSAFPCNPQQPTQNLTCERYRITARSAPQDGRAHVMLQSIFAAD